MFIYLSNNFSGFIFETVHILMHVGDLVQMDYEHHSHGDAETLIELSHDHGGFINHTDNDLGDLEQTLNLVNKDKVEYTRIDLPPLYQRKDLTLKKFDFLCSESQSLIYTVYPPPQVQS